MVELICDVMKGQIRVTLPASMDRTKRNIGPLNMTVAELCGQGASKLASAASEIENETTVAPFIDIINDIINFTFFVVENISTKDRLGADDILIGEIVDRIIIQNRNQRRNLNVKSITPSIINGFYYETSG